jgi:hypothetical protein
MVALILTVMVDAVKGKVMKSGQEAIMAEAVRGDLVSTAGSLIVKAVLGEAVRGHQVRTAGSNGQGSSRSSSQDSIQLCSSQFEFIRRADSRGRFSSRLSGQEIRQPWSRPFYGWLSQNRRQSLLGLFEVIMSGQQAVMVEAVRVRQVRTADSHGRGRAR